MRGGADFAGGRRVLRLHAHHGAGGPPACSGCGCGGISVDGNCQAGGGSTTSVNRQRAGRAVQQHELVEAVAAGGHADAVARHRVAAQAGARHLRGRVPGRAAARWANTTTAPGTGLRVRLS
jgi:hypothetical protein